MKTYSDIISQLESFLTRRGINYSLDNFEQLLDQFGNPHRRLPLIIHIAGTNGKGSTAAFIEAGLMAAGKTVGVYSSPHLESYRERFRINGIPISETEFSDIFSYLLQKVEPTQIATEFELLTLGAFLWFVEKKPDFVILETGLGGRLDATNVVLPIASIITRIALDHQTILGETIPEIASEKAGIIKPKTLVITPETQDVEALEVIKTVANIVKSPVALSKNIKRDKPFTHLKGVHQEENAGLAFALLRLILRERDEEQILKSLDNAKNPGRFEIIRETAPIIIRDGAHNESGIASLIESLKRYYPNTPVTFVTGVLKTKDARMMLSHLLKYGQRVYYIDFWPGNSYSEEEIKALILEEKLAFLRDLEAIKALEGDLIVVTGSLYFIGKVN